MSSILRAILKQPVSTFNALVIVFIACGWYFTREHNLEKLSMALRAQEVRVDRVEKRIEAGDMADVKQNAELQAQLGAANNRLSVIETNVQWLVRQQGGPARP